MPGSLIGQCAPSPAPIGLSCMSPPWLMVRAEQGQQVLIKSSRGGRKVKIIAPSGPASLLHLLSAALKQTGPDQCPDKIISVALTRSSPGSRMVASGTEKCNR